MGSSPGTFHPCIHRGTTGGFQCSEQLALSSLHTQGKRGREPNRKRHTPFIPAYTGKPDSARRMDGVHCLSSLHTQGKRISRGIAGCSPFIPAYTGQAILRNWMKVYRLCLRSGRRRRIDHKNRFPMLSHIALLMILANFPVRTKWKVRYILLYCRFTHGLFYRRRRW